jgi:hypothetical protein
VRRRARHLGVAVLVAGAITACRPTPAVSRQTALSADACRAPAPGDRQAFQADLGVQECPGLDGWRVFFVSSQEHSWIALQQDAVSWSAERAIVYEDPIGQFPGVDDTVPLEWRVDGGGDAVALIVTVKAQTPSDVPAAVSRQFVVRLERQRACLLGREPTAESARRLADSSRQCG